MNARDEQKEKRREDILNAGLDMFIRKGYSGTKIRDIAAALNMSVGLLFHYFPSKEALFTALVKLGVQGPNEMVGAIAGLEPLQFFECCAQQTLMYAKASAFTAKMFVLMSSAAYSEDIPQATREILSGINLYVSTAPLIEAGQQNGTIREGNPLALSTAFWTALQGSIELYAKDSSRLLPNAEWIVDIIKKK